MIGAIFIVNKNNNFISLKFIFILSFDTKSTNIKKNGKSITACLNKNIMSY